MKKEDLRVKITKKLIHEALLSLIEEKDLSSITVKELTEKAGVNRGSFYQHYKVLDDVIDEILQNIISDCGKLWTITKPFSPEVQKNNYLKTFMFIDEHKDLLKLISNAYGLLRTRNTVREKAKPFIVESYKALFKKPISSIDMDILFNYTFSGTFTIIHEWVNDDLPLNFDDIKHNASELTRVCIEHMKEKYDSLD